MEFRLPIPLIRREFSLGHRDKLFLLGSCFSEHMGEKLRLSGFHTCPDPHGIVYNPLSLFSTTPRIIGSHLYTEADLDQRGEFYFSYRHHGSFSDITAPRCLDKINTALSDAQAFWPGVSVVIFTLGTAFIYERTDKGDVVANCHKMPANIFRKRLLSPAEIVNAFRDIRSLIPPQVRVIFTVSPVRHWRDGAVENSRSKAVLLTAIHEITDQFPGTDYFPAYELMLDDLRDYRFYARDMLHPNELAVDYIWERFSEAYFTPETRELASSCVALNQARQHRPLFPDSDLHKKFEENLEARLKEFRHRYPHIFI